MNQSEAQIDDAGSAHSYNSSQHSVHSVEETSLPMTAPTRDVMISYKRLLDKLVTHLPEAPKRSNYHASALRIFKVTDIYKQQFLTNEQVRSSFGVVLSACYIFKFRIPCETYTHGLYLRMNGYAPRRTFDVFSQKIIDMFTCGRSISTKNVTPQVRKNISIFDYLQSLYVLD